MKDLASLGLVRVGHGLRRPECVRPAPGGGLCASDGRGGVTLLHPAGRQELILWRTADLPEPLLPNGIHPEPDGSFLVAHLGERSGGVFRLGGDGGLSPVVGEVDGMVLPPTNYVTRDDVGRIWITVSTVVAPRHLDYGPDARTGFVACADGRGARIVAAGLAYANECAFSRGGDWLFVSETFARRVSRFHVMPGGRLGTRETLAEFGEGDFPDGLHVDADGTVWVACIVGNRCCPSGRRVRSRCTSTGPTRTSWTRRSPSTAPA